jgi:hypothetical protein
MWMKTKILALSLASLVACGFLAARADNDGKRGKPGTLKKNTKGAPSVNLAVVKLSYFENDDFGSFLIGEIQATNGDYKVGRSCSFSQWKNGGWVSLQKNKIPALKKGKTFSVRCVLRTKPKPGTKFRLQLHPKDSMPQDDQKTITVK